jgi:hypothetical protein
LKRDSESGVVVLIALLIVPWTSLLFGWVASIMWGWFVVPWLNAPQLPLLNAIGVSFIVSLYVNQSASTEGKSTMELVMAATLRPLIALAFAAIVHAFM